MTSVSILVKIQTEEAGVWMVGWDSLRILQLIKMPLPVHVPRSLILFYSVGMSLFLFLFRVVTNLLFSPLAVICIVLSTCCWHVLYLLFPCHVHLPTDSPLALKMWKMSSL